MAATELQAVAHGADTVQFFQLKQALGGSEKFHGAVISHANRTDTRVFKEVAKLGHDLRKVGPVIKDSQTKARVALSLTGVISGLLSMSMVLPRT